MKSKLPVHAGSGNVFADVGFDNPEDMKLRADLVQQLREIIGRKHLTQAAAAKLMGIKQPDLSALLNGRLTKYSLERLLRFMTILDRDVKITVKAKPRHRSARLTIAFG
jgi:predicted XRE-type DNA-binding protein